MRNLKKFLALVLAMIMVVSAAAVVSADFTDVAADSKYATAINDLAVKKIIVGTTETTFSPDADVQRYQMALLVARATTGIVDNADWANGVKIFDDVTDDHFKGAISYAFVNGIIKGRDAKTFDPAGNIAYIDALTMAVRALGFDGLEYPMGFFKKASELGLTDDVAVYELDATLNRAETAQIIYNMIYVVRENGLTMAAEYFDRVVVRTSDLFVISCTPKQTYAASYQASTNKNETFVGIQPLVNGVPSGEVIYLTTEQLGIEKADVEKYFNYAVELINYDAKTGKFDEVKLGDAPDTFREAGVTISGNTIKLGANTYDVVSAISNNVLRNELVALAGDGIVPTQAKTLVTDADGNVIYNGQLVARLFQFGGSTLKYYAALVQGNDASGQKLFDANAIVSEELALEAWGFKTDKVEYTKYATLSAAGIDGYKAYVLDCFDDNKDGKYDRVFANKVYMSSYSTSVEKVNNKDVTFVNNITVAGNNVALSEITFSDTSAQKTGTLYVYTYNDATKTVNVLDTVTAKTGTLNLVDGTRLKLGSREAMSFIIDGTKYIPVKVQGSGNNRTEAEYVKELGAELITDDVTATYADFTTKGDFATTNTHDWVNTTKVGKPVNYVTYGKMDGTDLLLFVEHVADPAAATPKGDLVVMTGADQLDVDTTFTNLVTKVYKKGILDKAFIEKIDGKVVADLYIKGLSNLLFKDELYFPGLIYLATQNADKEYTVLNDAFNPYVALTTPDELTEFGLVDASAAKTGTTVEFRSGLSTVPNYANKIFTDKDTVFYFINRTANGYLPGTTWYAEGAKTTVSTFIGAPSNASIDLGNEGMIFVDKLGIVAGDFANVVIVYEATAINGFGHYENSSSIVYVPKALDNVTVAGTAAALGLTDAKYSEEKYYKYAGAALNLQTGAKVDIILPMTLVDDDPATANVNECNVNAIYELDANGVVIARADVNGNPVPGRANKYFMTIAEAKLAGVLAAVENNAVLAYHNFGNGSYVTLHAWGAQDVVIDMYDAVSSVTAFPVQGDLAVATNFTVNAAVNGTSTTAALINGNKTVYYLASGLTDGSIVVLYQ